MKHLLVLAIILGAAACARGGERAATDGRPSLEGGWRARVTFASGPLKGRPYQFLITYSRGGGLVASSNVDDKPAYGSWGRVGDRSFKATYTLWTQSANRFSGSGVFSENITLSETGDAYSAGISYQFFDANDRPLAGQTGSGTVTASRIIVG